MGRLIDVPASAPLPPALALRVGDLLLVRATGGRVSAGADALEPLGALTAGALASDGTVLSAAGDPDAVAFLARRPGRARVELPAGGDPRRGARRAAVLEVSVAP